MRRFSIVIGITLAVALSSCSATDSRQQVLNDFADEIAIPRYQQIVNSAGDMRASVDALCARPAADTRQAAHDAITHTALAWRLSEAVWVGPVMDMKSASVINSPIRPQDIDKLIANEAISLESNTIGNAVGADERGLGGLDYVVRSGKVDLRHCAYLAANAKAIEDEAKSVFNAWIQPTGEKPPYRETFDGSAPNADVDTSIDAIVNDQINLLHRVGDMELGKALGSDTAKADPAAIHHTTPTSATDETANRLTSVRMALIGDGPAKGLSPLLGDELTQRIRTTSDDINTALLRIDGPLNEAAISDRDDVAALKTKVDELRRIVSTEVVSKLGVAVGFSDADGDSAK